MRRNAPEPDWHAGCKGPGWEVVAVDARDQQLADVEQALRQCLAREEALLHDSMLRIRALEKEGYYLREQYAALEKLYNALLQKAALDVPAPPCG
jgi:hypothetical protein